MMQVPLASADATAGTGTSVTVRIGQHDMVVDHGDAGPKPLELMTASLAACSAMTTRTYLGRLGERGDVEVVVTLDGGPPTLLYRRVLLPTRIRPAEAHELADALERTELTMMLRPSFTIRTVVEHDGEALN
ncbi:OsmC family protein [Pseudonocardia sp. TRM90224]|uniref:OsmC family protein n=1 Tax=Pseudonocardia sp. TRM90224 TaxID=2812678 RepID=UPI001E5F525E|nr:OsmC family protein [Pseudonocardia sp. TRM90224]